MKLLVNIDVPDLDAAERFYAQAFDLQPARRLGQQVREMLGADAAIYLLETPSGSVAAGDARRGYARHWMPVHCDLAVDDVDVALVRALAAGAVQEGDVREASWGRIVQLADPFGHGWCLIEFGARGYDAIADEPDG